MNRVFTGFNTTKQNLKRLLNSSKYAFLRAKAEARGKPPLLNGPNLEQFQEQTVCDVIDTILEHLDEMPRSQPLVDLSWDLMCLRGYYQPWEGIRGWRADLQDQRCQDQDGDPDNDGPDAAPQPVAA